MAKETKKQIVAQTRNDVAREYKHRIESLQNKNSHIINLWKDEEKKRIEYQNKAEKLEEELNQYKDWVERLQSYIDMNEEDRANAIARDKANFIVNQKLNNLLNIYSSIFNFY